jgi:hypothetical protein
LIRSSTEHEDKGACYGIRKEGDVKHAMAPPRVRVGLTIDAATRASSHRRAGLPSPVQGAMGLAKPRPPIADWPTPRIGNSVRGCDPPKGTCEPTGSIIYKRAGGMGRGLLCEDGGGARFCRSRYHKNRARIVHSKSFNTTLRTSSADEHFRAAPSRPERRREGTAARTALREIAATASAEAAVA